MRIATLSSEHFVTVRQALAGRAAAERYRQHRARGTTPTPTVFADGADMSPNDRNATGAPPLVYHLTYEDADGNPSTRIVTLRRIDPGRDYIRLVCWCHSANDVRVFQVDRIKEIFCVVTGEVYDDAVRYFTDHPMLNEPVDPEGYALAVCKHEVNVLVCVGAADGYFDPDEQEKVLIHVYDRMPQLSLDEFVLRKRIAKLAPDVRAFESAMWKMGRFHSGDPVLLMRSLRKVVDADGQLAPEEVAFVSEIQQRLQSALNRY